MPDWWINFWCDYGWYFAAFILGMLAVLAVEILIDSRTVEYFEDDEQMIEIEEIDHN